MKTFLRGFKRPGGREVEIEYDPSMFFKSIPISSSEILDLFNNPKELLPAPGGRKYYVLHHGVVHYRYGTIPYIDAQRLFSYITVWYASQTDNEFGKLGTNWTLAAPTGGLNVTSEVEEDQYSELLSSTDSGSKYSWSAEEIENQAVLFGFDKNSNIEENGIAEGDGTLTIRLWYSIINGAPV